MKNEGKTTPWKVTARYRDDGKIRVIRQIVEIKYRVHETRYFRGKRETQVREETHYTNILCHEKYYLLVKAVSDFLPYIEDEAFRIVEERNGLEPVSANIRDGVKVRRIPRPKKPKPPKAAKDAAWKGYSRAGSI